MDLREANHIIALMKVIGGTVWPQYPPLHRVFRLHHAELTRQIGGIGSLRKLRRLDGRADKYSVAVSSLAQGLGKTPDRPQQNESNRATNIGKHSTSLLEFAGTGGSWP
jgi:hypothetical protein